MIINYLELNNFRQFTGKQIIKFSNNPDKKVTIVMAESGAGKTTLLQCFQWIFYGECNFKLPINNEIKNTLNSKDSTTVYCSINLTHEHIEYTIARKQTFSKANIQIQANPSMLIVETKDKDGISNKYYEKDALKIVKEIMPKDLLPYFFLEGENLTKVGEQMSKGKSGSNNEFIKAIKGLLGLNYLYDAQKHLNMVISEYNNEISRYTNNPRLSKIINDKNSCNDKIEKCNQRLSTIDDDIQYYEDKRDEMNEKVINYKELGIKQKASRSLSMELLELADTIKKQKSFVMKKFSSDAVYLIMNSFVPIINDTLKNTDSLDKGIPGMNVQSIDYMLQTHKCICGHDLIEGSNEWNTLIKLRDFLPPHYIGSEIKQFLSDIDDIKSRSNSFINDFEKARIDLNRYISKYNAKVDELDHLNSEIGNFNEDVADYKTKEQMYYKRVIDLKLEKNKLIDEKQNANVQLNQLNEEEKALKTFDQKINNFQRCRKEAEELKDKIINHCANKESDTRKALELEINNIFKDFYNEDIKFFLDENYDVLIKTSSLELLEDFTSGGQDVVVALAFIGAIIELNRKKDLDKDDEMLDEKLKEPYPLIMDAPTSKFGMKQMESFSKIMPKITDQIIVFINDKDGPILKEKMSNKIGSEWKIVKEDSYHAFLEEVK